MRSAPLLLALLGIAIVTDLVSAYSSCTNLKSPNLCAAYSFCYWTNGKCKLAPITTSPTPLPTEYPTSSAPTSNQPTLAPTKLPTNKPTSFPTPPTRTPTLKPTFPPTSLFPSSSPTIYCEMPPGFCPSIKNKNSCFQWTGCVWNRKACRPRPVCPPPSVSPSRSPTISPSNSPSLSPTGTKSPTGSPSHIVYIDGETAPPTTSPSLSPTNLPTTLGPSASPSHAPTDTRTNSPSLFTLKPTPIPTALPRKIYCGMPDAGCSSLTSPSDCLNYLGCEYSNGVCSNIPACANYGKIIDCSVRGFAFDASSNMLPGCVRGMNGSCDDQRAKVYNALNMPFDCGSFPMVKCLDGGCTLRTDVRAQEEHEEMYDIFPIEFFVVPEGGIDSDQSPGSRIQPFATVEYALSRVRAFPGRKRRIVLLGPGTHRISSTIMLTQQDSGLVITGENDPVISGAISANLNWKQSKTGSGIYSAQIPPEVASQLGLLSTFFVNGKPAIRARYPNINGFFDVNFAPGGNIEKWMHTPSDVPLTDQIEIRVRAGDYGYFTSGKGGTCSGVFEPDIGYFCNPNNEAQGGCPYKIPSGMFMNPVVANSIGAPYWNRGNVFFHTFQEFYWGMWTFQLAPITSSPTTSPSHFPTHEPSYSPTLHPSASPSSSRPSKSPVTSQPTLSPSNSPSTPRPSSSPVISQNPTPLPSKTPSNSPSYSPSKKANYSAHIFSNYLCANFFPKFI